MVWCVRHTVLLLLLLAAGTGAQDVSAGCWWSSRMKAISLNINTAQQLLETPTAWFEFFFITLVTAALEPSAAKTKSKTHIWNHYNFPGSGAIPSARDQSHDTPKVTGTPKVTSSQVSFESLKILSSSFPEHHAGTEGPAEGQTPANRVVSAPLCASSTSSARLFHQPISTGCGQCVEEP